MSETQAVEKSEEPPHEDVVRDIVPEAEAVDNMDDGNEADTLLETDERLEKKEEEADLEPEMAREIGSRNMVTENVTSDKEIEGQEQFALLSRFKVRSPS